MITTIGYQFIKPDGYPLGNVQPTFEAAEHIARFEPHGTFIELCHDSVTSTHFMRRYFVK